MKDSFGNFLQEANEELYGTKVSALEFEELEGSGLKIEWALKGDDLIVHVYKAKGMRWPLTYAKELYKLMDKHAAGEKRDIGYEELVDSWYIKSAGFTEGKLAPKMVAKTLCTKILKDLGSSVN